MQIGTWRGIGEYGPVRVSLIYMIIGLVHVFADFDSAGLVRRSEFTLAYAPGTRTRESSLREINRGRADG